MRARVEKVDVLGWNKSVKAKIDGLEEEVRAGHSRIMRKELTSVVQGVSGRSRFLVRFQNGCENNLSSNQLTVVIVDKNICGEGTFGFYNS